jgi:membrane protease YdiL (CAAX protease family)
MSDGWTPPGQPPARDPGAPEPGPPPAGPSFPPPGSPYPPPATPPYRAPAPYGTPPGAVYPHMRPLEFAPPVRDTGFRAPAGEPRPYPQLLRSPSYRWWRPLVGLFAGLAAGVVLLFGLIVVFQIGVIASGGEFEDLERGPLGFVSGNLLLAAAIPMSIIGVVLGFLRGPGWLASVELRIRWGWLARCSAWMAVWAAGGSMLWFALDGLPSTGGEDAALLIVLCLLTTPLQAAGEEYMMRGWLSQVIGAWFSRAAAGAVVAGLVSATVFALLHGTQNAWLFADRWAFGIIASYLVWRTGGLEAPIALHAISNISSIIPAALEGTLDDSLTITEAPIGTVAIDVVLLLIAMAVLLRIAKRRGVARLGPVRQESPAGAAG